jgi:hypothetical protein
MRDEHELDGSTFGGSGAEAVLLAAPAQHLFVGNAGNSDTG